MIEKDEQSAAIPKELQVLPDKNKEEKAFFETPANSYRKGFCISNWIAKGGIILPEY